MGAWRDFIDTNGSSGEEGSRFPGFVAALKSRPLRAAGLIAGSVLTVSLLFAVIGGPGHHTLRSALSLPPILNKGPSFTPPVQHLSTEDRTHNENVQPDAVAMDLSGNQQLLEPYFTVDKETGLEYPPDINPMVLNKYKRANATFVALVRNEELEAIKMSMREVERAFNRKAGYPWVFLNDKPFTEAFKEGVRARTRSEIHFGLIPTEHWSYPSWIDQEKAARERKVLEQARVIYGGSESYRHMCRFNSGFFYKHEIMQKFDWYWRIEPGVEYYCDVDYDVSLPHMDKQLSHQPFLFMERNNKTYSFTVAIFEYQKTVETLWDTVRSFVKKYPEYVAEDNALHFMVDDISKGIDGPYNLCHFWSNFEIADMRFWRSQAYEDFFNYLDETGGFFYERWGDAPVHSIAAALFLPRTKIHQFNDIGYRHNPYIQKKFIDNGKCSCDPKSSFDLDGYSCMKHAWRVFPQPEQ